MSEELRECPFCGKKVAIVTNALDTEECRNFDNDSCPCNEYEESDSCGMCSVVCNFNDGGCGASTGWHSSEEGAIKAWNTRSKVWNRVGMQEINSIIEELLLERDAEKIEYITEESIKIHKEFCDNTIAALEELKQYRAIGTIEEYRKVIEKQKPKKVKEIHVDEYICPNCGAENNCDDMTVQDNYCPECGQAIEVEWGTKA